jgi:hypothetical protein
MDFGDEVYVTAYKSYSVFNLYRFNPASSDFTLVGTVDHSMNFFERPVIRGDKAYLLGTSYSEAQFLVYDRATRTMTKISDTPSTAMRQAILIDGDSVIYAGGGSSTNGNDLRKEFWKYSLKTEKWTRLNDMPFNSISSNCFTVSGRNFAIATDKRLWEYIPTDDSWISRSVYPGPGNTELMNVVCGGRVYLGHGGYASKEIFAYDPVADAWSPLQNELPLLRAHPVDFQSGGKIYFGGGSASQTDFWMYDPSKE